MTTKLFVSHISEEGRVAVALKTALMSLFSGDVDVFASSDVDSIAGGRNWLEAVQTALNEAQAVIVLCSKASVMRPWVQFEVGGAWMLHRRIIPVCHSGLRPRDLPLPLLLLEGMDFGPEGVQRLYDAVAQTIGTKRKASSEDIAAHAAALRAAELSYGSALQFERYIDIVLPPPGRLEADEIPDDALVESNDESLKLFSLINTGARTWKDIARQARRVKDQRWLRQLQHCIRLASNDEAFRPVQAVFHSAIGSFQPQLAKKETQTDGSCRFHVHLVETVVAPLTEVQNEFGLMATLLRLGLRFRYEVIQKFHRALQAAVKSGKHEMAADLRAQLRGAIEVIENDALSRGAENIERNAVVDLFVDEEDQAAMAQVQEDWDVSRERLFREDPAPDLQEMRAILDAMRELNCEFMIRSTRRFHAMVAERWPAVPTTAAGALAA